MAGIPMINGLDTSAMADDTNTPEPTETTHVEGVEIEALRGPAN